MPVGKLTPAARKGSINESDEELLERAETAGLPVDFSIYNPSASAFGLTSAGALLLFRDIRRKRPLSRDEERRVSRLRFNRFAQGVRRSTPNARRRSTILTSTEGAPFESLQLGGRTILG